MSLAKRVRDYRYAKGWGPDELAQRAGISRTALYQIESGKTELPRASTLRRIAEALEVPIDVLLGNMEDPLMKRQMAARPVAIETDAASNGAALIGVSNGYPYETNEGTVKFDPHNGLHRNGDLSVAQQQVLVQKFQDLLETPMAGMVTRMVEEVYSYQFADVEPIAMK